MCAGMYTTLTSPEAVEIRESGRYGGTVYALHHNFISCEDLTTQFVVRAGEGDELQNHEGMKRARTPCVSRRLYSALSASGQA